MAALCCDANGLDCTDGTLCCDPSGERDCEPATTELRELDDAAAAAMVAPPPPRIDPGLEKALTYPQQQLNFRRPGRRGAAEADIRSREGISIRTDADLCGMSCLGYTCGFTSGLWGTCFRASRGDAPARRHVLERRLRGFRRRVRAAPRRRGGGRPAPGAPLRVRVGDLDLPAPLRPGRDRLGGRRPRRRLPARRRSGPPGGGRARGDLT